MTAGKRKGNRRARVSVVMFVAFIVLIVSAVFDVLNLFADNVFKIIHGITGILFAATGTFHIAYNWRTLKHYFCKKRS